MTRQQYQEPVASFTLWQSIEGSTTKEEALQTISALKDLTPSNSARIGVHVGIQSYTHFGPNILSVLQEEGCSVFLDLKLHESPTTLRNVLYSLSAYDISLCSIHLTGGDAMISSAREGIERGAQKFGTQQPQLIGVAVLPETTLEDYIKTHRVDSELYQYILSNSLDISASGSPEMPSTQRFHQLCKLMGVSHRLERKVQSLIDQAAKQGVEGVLCSAEQVKSLHAPLHAHSWHYVVEQEEVFNYYREPKQQAVLEKNKETITQTVGVDAVRALLCEGVTDLIVRKDQHVVGSKKASQQETSLSLMKNAVEQEMKDLQ